MLARAMMMAASAVNNYAAVVLADKPVAYWPLNETSGTTAYDLSGNGNDATYTTGFALGSPPIASGLSVCCNLTGTGSYISGPASPVNIPVGNDSYTLEIWANSTYAESQYAQYGAQLLGFGGYGTNNYVNALKFMANSTNNGNGFT
ncbi:MAG: hypothetical protein ACP5GF_13975, partial [Thiomonas sp.]